jgi:hypothetical protein
MIVPWFAFILKKGGARNGKFYQPEPQRTSCFSNVRECLQNNKRSLLNYTLAQAFKQEAEISMSRHQAGTYFLIVTSEKHDLITFKIIKK